MSLSRRFPYVSLRILARLRSRPVSLGLATAGVAFIVGVAAALAGFPDSDSITGPAFLAAELILAAYIPLHVLLRCRKEQNSGRLSRLAMSAIPGGQIITGLVLASSCLEWGLILICSTMTIVISDFRVSDSIFQAMILFMTLFLVTAAVVVQGPKLLPFLGHRLLLLTAWGLTQFFFLFFIFVVALIGTLNVVTAESTTAAIQTLLCLALLASTFWLYASFSIQFSPPSIAYRVIRFCWPLAYASLCFVGYGSGELMQQALHNMTAIYVISVVFLITAYWEGISHSESNVSLFQLSLRNAASVVPVLFCAIVLYCYYHPNVSLRLSDGAALLAFVVSTMCNQWVIVLVLVQLEGRFLRWQSICAFAMLLTKGILSVYLRDFDVPATRIAAYILSPSIHTHAWAAAYETNTGHDEVIIAEAVSMILVFLLGVLVWAQKRTIDQPIATVAGSEPSYGRKSRRSFSVSAVQPLATALRRISPVVEVLLLCAVRKSRVLNLLVACTLIGSVGLSVGPLLVQEGFDARGAFLVVWRLCALAVLFFGFMICVALFFRVKVDRERGILLRLRNSALPVWQLVAGYSLGTSAGFLLPAICIGLVATCGVFSLGLATASTIYFLAWGVAFCLISVVAVNLPATADYGVPTHHGARRLASIVVNAVAGIVLASCLLGLWADLFGSGGANIVAPNGAAHDSTYAKPGESASQFERNLQLIFPTYQTLSLIGMTSTWPIGSLIGLIVAILGSGSALLYWRIARIDNHSFDRKSDRFALLIQHGARCSAGLIPGLFAGLVVPQHAPTRQSCVSAMMAGVIAFMGVLFFSIRGIRTPGELSRRTTFLRTGAFVLLETAFILAVVFVRQQRSGISLSSFPSCGLISVLIIAAAFRIWSLGELLRGITLVFPSGRLLTWSVAVVTETVSLNSGSVWRWLKSDGPIDGLMGYANVNVLALLTSEFIEPEKISKTLESQLFWVGALIHGTISAVIIAVGAGLQFWNARNTDNPKM